MRSGSRGTEREEGVDVTTGEKKWRKEEGWWCFFASLLPTQDV